MMCECIICLIMDDMFVIDHLGHYRETHTLVLSFSQEYEFQMVRCSYELICCYRDTFCFCCSLHDDGSGACSLITC